MNTITFFLVLKSLDLIFDLVKKEKIPEKVAEQIIEKINKIESLMFK